MKRFLIVAAVASSMLATSALAQTARSQIKGYTYYKDRAGKFRWKVVDTRTGKTSLYSTKGYTKAGLRHAAAKIAAQESCSTANFRLRQSTSGRYYSLLHIGKGADKGKLLGRVAGSFSSKIVARARLNRASQLSCRK